MHHHTGRDGIRIFKYLLIESVSDCTILSSCFLLLNILFNVFSLQIGNNYISFYSLYLLMMDFCLVFLFLKALFWCHLLIMDLHTCQHIIIYSNICIAISHMTCLKTKQITKKCSINKCWLFCFCSNSFLFKKALILAF